MNAPRTAHMRCVDGAAADRRSLGKPQTPPEQGLARGLSLFVGRASTPARPRGATAPSCLVVCGDVRYRRTRQVHEVGRCEPERLVVRAGLDHDRLPIRDAEIDDDRVAPTANGRHRSELELRLVASEILFRREVHRVPAAAVNLSQLAQVEPRRGRQDCADVAPGRLDDERLRNVAGRDAERLRLR